MSNTLYAELALFCAVILSLLHIQASSNRKDGKEQNRLILLMGLSALYCFLDALWGFLAYDALHRFSSATYGLTYFCFAGIGIVSFFWYFFAENYIYSENGNGAWVKYVDKVPLLLIFALLAANPSGKTLFYIDAAGTYCRGSHAALAFLCCCIYYIAALLHTAYNLLGEKDLYRWRRELVVLLYCVIPLIAGILNGFFPERPMFSAGYMLAGMVIYLFNVIVEREHFLVRKHEAGIQRRDAMLKALTEDFNSIFFLNCDTKKIVVYRAGEEFAGYVKADSTEMSIAAFEKAIRGMVYTADREACKKALSTEQIIREVAEGASYFVNYRIMVEGELSYRQAKLVRDSARPNENAYIVGIHNVERRIRLEMQRQEQESIINGLAEDFDCILYVNTMTGQMRVYRISDEFLRCSNGWYTITENQAGLTAFVESMVVEEDRLRYYEESTRARIFKELSTKPAYFLNYRISLNGDVLYYQSKYVLDTSANGEGNLIVGVHNVDRQTRREMERSNRIKRFAQKESIYKTAINADAVGYYECNLTQDIIPDGIVEIIDGVKTDATEAMGLHKPLRYSEYVEYFAAHNVVLDKELYFQRMERDALLEMFRRGERIVESVCWAYSPVGVYRANKKTMFLASDGVTGDVLAICVIKDVTEYEKNRAEERRRREVIGGLSSDYDCVVFVELSSGAVANYHISEPFMRHITELGETPDYQERMRRYVNTMVVEEDRGFFWEKSELSYVIAELQDKVSFFINHRISLEGKVLYYQTKFMLSTDKKNLIIGFYSIDETMCKELQQRELLEAARVRAEAASVAKSEFLSHMSHDIRTPINGVMGMIEIARRHAQDQERVNECLTKMERTSQHLLELINDVLDMSRIESGKAQMARNPMNLCLLLDNCVSVISGQLADRTLTLKTEFGDFANKYLLGDELHLRQVILNILGNAVKFTPDGGTITFRVSEETKDEDTALFRFIVSDTGIGMDSEFMEHIWEAFSQRNGNIRTNYSGTGLGMPIAKNLTELMGGTIEVESELHVGTTFTVTLPIPIDHTPRRGGESDVAAVDLRGMRVMLVEDNELNREIAQELLEDEGITVTALENGRLAVDAFAASPVGSFDVILMDIMMPEMDGLAATRCIRKMQRPDAGTVPIVALTANAFAEDVHRTREAGMNSHLSKPIELARLRKVLFAFAGGAEEEEEV